MATFIAKNNIRISQQYAYRTLYDIRYPEEFTNTINFWNESTLYGKIDIDNNVLVLNNENIKVLKDNTVSNNSNNYALNVVSDSFSEFLSEVQKADRLRIIPKSRLNPFKIAKSYNPTLNEYSTRINFILNLSLKNNKLLNQIFTINDFLNEFCFLVANVRVPFTQTAYILSNMYSPLSTGLVIELSSLKHDYDEPKVTQYLDDVNYEFFHNTAQKYSFFVDKNAPWRMVYNVTTDYALQKFKVYGVNSLKEMQSKFYTPCYLTDWKLLKQSLLQFYTDRIFRKPSVQVPSYCDKNNISITTFKKELPNEDTYDDLFWIKLYYFVRLKEQNISLTQLEFENKLITLSKLHKLNGEEYVLNLINKETKLFLDGGKNPSYNDFIKIDKYKNSKLTSYILKF